MTHDQFYIVVDAWDNSHSRDAELSHITTVADVTVIVQKEGTILPIGLFRLLACYFCLQLL